MVCLSRVHLDLLSEERHELPTYGQLRQPSTVPELIMSLEILLWETPLPEVLLFPVLAISLLDLQHNSPGRDT